MTGRRLRLFGRVPAARRTDRSEGAVGSVAFSESERTVAPPPGLAPAPAPSLSTAGASPLSSVEKVFERLLGDLRSPSAGSGSAR